MHFQFRITPGEGLALRDPEDTTLGRNIVRQGLQLMHRLGYEQFTFKKLAEAMHTTEASIYRYFENKHRMLLYLLTWYWSYLEFLVITQLQNIAEPEQKILKVIELLVGNLPDIPEDSGFDKQALHDLVVSESSKTYLTREVDAINEVQLFKPYKDLCSRIAALFLEYAPHYPTPRSLSSTLIETAHFQAHFMMHLPSLTDFGGKGHRKELEAFLEHLVFSCLNKR